MNIIINIKKEIGHRCIIKEDGQKIYNKIYTTLKEGKVVTLDFNNVTQFSGSFFNYAIGQLIRNISAEDLRYLLKIENINENGKLIIQRVIENAIEHYKKRR